MAKSFRGEQKRSDDEEAERRERALETIDWVSLLSYVATRENEPGPSIKD